MHICNCDNPKPPLNSAGKVAGNVCQECSGRIQPFPPQHKPPTRTSSTGRVLIAVQHSMGDADFRSDQECHEFATHLVDTMPESLRQKLMTWRANRTGKDDLQKAQEIDRARRGAA